jgi:predicted dehydrogenase
LHHIGIIGAGARSLVLVEYIKQHTDCVLKDVCDTDHERIQVFRRLSQIETLSFTNYTDLLNCAEIDTIIIGTPDYSHTTILLDCLKANKHILCEKPVAVTLNEANQVICALNQDQNLVCSTPLVLRFHPLYRALIDAIPQIGDIKLITATDYVNGAGYFRRWHRLREKSGGLVLHEGIHTIDIIQSIIGRSIRQASALAKLAVYTPQDGANEVCCRCNLSDICGEYFNLFADPLYELYSTSTQQEGYPRDLCVYTSEKDTPDEIIGHIEYLNGPLLNYTLCLFAPQRNRELRFIGDAGVLYCDEISRKLIFYPRRNGKSVERVVQVPTERYGGGDRDLFNDFIHHINMGNSNRKDMLLALDSTIVTLAIETAIQNRSNTWIKRLDDGTYIFTQTEL